jgi:hypothetical protein
MIPEERTLIFVTGPQRAGTTLLAGLLTGGETYPLLPECTHIRNALANHRTIRNDTAPDRARAYLGDGISLYRDLIHGMVTNAIEYAKTPPRRFLVLKDPKLAPLLADIPLSFDNTLRSFAIVRDPRDVVASMVDVIRRKGDAGEKVCSQAIKSAERQFDEVAARSTIRIRATRSCWCAMRTSRQEMPKPLIGSMLSSVTKRIASASGTPAIFAWIQPTLGPRHTMAAPLRALVPVVRRPP